MVVGEGALMGRKAREAEPECPVLKNMIGPRIPSRKMREDESYR